MRRQQTSTKLVVAIALVTACCALPARGLAGGKNEISLRVSNSFVLDEGMAAFSSNDRLVQVELGYARALWPLTFGALWVEGSWTAGQLESSLFGQQFDTSVFLHSFTAGARYAVPILSWVIPHVRLGLGLGLGHFEVGPGSGASAPNNFEAGTSTSFGLAGYALAGVEVLIPTAALRRFGGGFSAGIAIEGGLNVGTSLSFDASPERDEDKLLISLQGTGLGSFNPTGPVFRIGAVVRF